MKTRRADLAAAICGVVFALFAAGSVWATAGGEAACVDPVTGAAADATACVLPPDPTSAR